MKKVLVLVFLALLLANCFAVLESDSVKVFAVTDNGNAMSADLILDLKPGTGRIWTSVEPLVGTSTQSTEKLAVLIARNYSSEVDDFDFFFEIKSNASLVEGPSAGAAMTLLTISMLQDKPVPDDVSLTGTITTGGGVGPVGGVFEKSKEAARIGIKLFMIPPGESRQTVKIDGEVKSVNLVEYANQNWGMKVVEVNNIDEVLSYAFADIESIDVNAGIIPTVEFVPLQIELNENLVPMKALTEQYISEAEGKIKSAKNALSGTLLAEPEVIDAMLINLNESEKTLATSKILYEQNYLYSAANFAFLAMVNSSFVRDVAEDPGLLSRASTSFSNKVDNLDRKIDSFALDLNRYVTIDNFEWHVAAKERLSWAMLKVDELKETKDVIIIVERNGIDLDRISDVMDYEYALGWYEVSQDFFELTKNSELAIRPDDSFKDYINSYIQNTENGLSTLGEEEREDVLRRLDGAKLARENGWMYSALFDSASSLALTNAMIFNKNKELPELQNSLLEKIEELDRKISESSHEIVWARLYLDHSKYYLDSSLFYKDQGQIGIALNKVKSGVELVFLAEAVFEAADASYSYFDLLPSDQVIPLSPNWQAKPYMETLLLVFFIILVLLGAMLLFGLAVSGNKIHILKPFTFEDSLNEILRSQKKLRKRIEKGHLTQEQFDVLNKPLQSKLNKLLAERKAVSANYVLLDLNKSKVTAFEKALRDLRQQLVKKQITPEDFKSNTSFYKKRISLLKHMISEEEQKIASEKKQAEKEFRKKKKPSGKNRA